MATVIFKPAAPAQPDSAITIGVSVSVVELRGIILTLIAGVSLQFVSALSTSYSIERTKLGTNLGEPGDFIQSAMVRNKCNSSTRLCVSGNT